MERSVGSVGRPVHPLVERLAAYSWRLLVTAAAGVAILWLVGRLWMVFLPLFISLLLTRVLTAPTKWLRSRGWRPGVAAAAVLVASLVVLIATIGLLGLAVGNQAQDVAPTMTRAVDDMERWLIDDAPGDLNRRDIEQFRTQLSDAAGGWVRNSGGMLVSGALLFLQLLLSIGLSIIIAFFALKDGEATAQRMQRLVPEKRRDLVARLAGRAWSTLGAYLRGAALLGVLEGIIIGATLAFVGAELAVPVAILTFIMAFIPFAGAILAGTVAVLVTLTTASPTAALVVLAVAVLVQQLDNDFLAPVIYGKSLNLHPVVVLLAIIGGGALFGLPGTLLAVPVTAVIVNSIAEARTPTASDAMARTTG